MMIISILLVDKMNYTTICLGCKSKQEILEVLNSQGCPNCDFVRFQDIDENGQVLRIWQLNFSDKRLSYMSPNPIAVWSIDL